MGLWENLTIGCKLMLIVQKTPKIPTHNMKDLKEKFQQNEKKKKPLKMLTLEPNIHIQVDRFLFMY